MVQGIATSGHYGPMYRKPQHVQCNSVVCSVQRNGADYAVFVNTAQEFDGSDAGASPDEAVSWGKIRISARPVKVGGWVGGVFIYIGSPLHMS